MIFSTCSMSVETKRFLPSRGAMLSETAMLHIRIETIPLSYAGQNAAYAGGMVPILLFSYPSQPPAVALRSPLQPFIHGRAFVSDKGKPFHRPRWYLIIIGGFSHGTWESLTECSSPRRHCQYKLRQVI